ncbi:hypothetical protein B0H13DRAFT_1859707 [Mycena leptocephala]|nr:hypothetical protein B0H13DRAFT_1859707 [Mycena leptocephala]
MCSNKEKLTMKKKTEIKQKSEWRNSAREMKVQTGNMKIMIKVHIRVQNEGSLEDLRLRAQLMAVGKGASAFEIWISCRLFTKMGVTTWMPPELESSAISNKTPPPVARATPPSLSSSEERECGRRGLRATSGGRRWVPPVPEPSSMLLLSLGCSSEERPDHSAEAEQGGTNVPSNLSPKPGGETELDIVVNTLLTRKGDVCRSDCDMLALVPLYLEVCDPLNTGDHDADAHALDTFYFVHGRSARLAAKRQPPSLPSPQAVMTPPVRPKGSTSKVKSGSATCTSCSNPVTSRKRPCPGSAALPPAAKRVRTASLPSSLRPADSLEFLSSSVHKAPSTPAA